MRDVVFFFFLVEFRQGKHKFSCTVYYATQFDALRRKCGMSAMYVQSLMRCTAWDACGGKSKAGFFKTHGKKQKKKKKRSTLS